MVPLPVVSCEGCGACCTRAGSPPFAPGEAAPADLPGEARRLLKAGPGEACTWFDPGPRRCRWYGFRPRACREFDPGGADCLRMRAGYSPRVTE